MSTAGNDSATPIAHRRDEGEARWFLNALSLIKTSGETSSGGLAIVEQVVPRGPASPMHVHHREGEWFYVIEGELVVWAGGQLFEAPRGGLVYGPPNVPHTFDVTSEEARFLLLAQPAGFERFLRAVSEPAGALTHPPADSPVPDTARLTAVASEFGIEILGPPGIPS